MGESDYPNLGHLLAGYFHQDWSLEASTWEGVVSAYTRDQPECAVVTAQDIERLLAEYHDDAQLERFLLGELGSYYFPRPDHGGPDVRRWLEQVRECLLKSHGSAEKAQRRMRIAAVALWTYVIAVGTIILWWNAAAGGLVQGWYEEYVGADGLLSGSGKWRTMEGEAFENVALLYGTWVYPFSLIAAALFLRLGFEVRGWGRKLLCMLGCATAVYVLYRFLALGLFRAVTS